MVQVYILKDCWRDESLTEEGQFYDAVCGSEKVDGLESIYSYGTVRIHNADDDTVHAIRKSISPEENQLPVRLCAKDLTVLEPLVLEWNSPRYIVLEGYTQDSARGIYHSSSEPPKNRVHSRLVMKSFGWTLPMFRSLPELLDGILDATLGDSSRNPCSTRS